MSEPSGSSAPYVAKQLPEAIPVFINPKDLDYGAFCGMRQIWLTVSDKLNRIKCRACEALDVSVTVRTVNSTHPQLDACLSLEKIIFRL